MSKLPEGFEKEFFELLTPVTSDSTLKGRRNLTVASFIILSIYFLGKSISDLRVLGLSLEGTDGTKALIVALMLILFWLALLCVNLFKDHEINKERKLLLHRHVSFLEKKLENWREKYNGKPDNHSKIAQLKEMEANFKVYIKQLNRTKTAQLLTKTTNYVESGLPIMLATLAIYFLSLDIYATLQKP